MLPIDGYEQRKDRDGKAIYIHLKSNKILYSYVKTLEHFYLNHR